MRFAISPQTATRKSLHARTQVIDDDPKIELSSVCMHIVHACAGDGRSLSFVSVRDPGIYIQAFGHNKNNN